MDILVQEKLNKLIAKLEAYYPEHKIFALSSIDDNLRENLTKIYKDAGFATVEELFSNYGYEVISGQRVKELRSFVMYPPGAEPDVIKPKIDSMLKRLGEYYPNHVISRGLQSEHKQLSMSVSGLYQWLGYASAREMLEAYGYTYETDGIGGRPENDYQGLIDMLVKKYEKGPKPKNMGALLFDNPELKGQIKTLQNKSQEIFGMTLKQYFAEQGIFAAKDDTHAVKKSNPAGEMQDAAREALAQLYSEIDNDVYGTFEQAEAQLKGLTVKRKKSGELYIFKAVECPEVLTIPYGINIIAKFAFQGEALKKVILPESVDKIEEKAFADCSGLENVEIANSRTMVANDAFEGCPYTYEPAPDPADDYDGPFTFDLDKKGNAIITGYTGTDSYMTIPEEIGGHPVVKIARGAFKGNSYLLEATMPDSVKTLEGHVFEDCISLESVRLSDSIGRLYTNVFNGCLALKKVNIPDGVEELKRSTFRDSPLEQLDIGCSLHMINSNAFFSNEHDEHDYSVRKTRNISRINVSPNNPYIRANNSMILSKDGRKLILALGSGSTCIIDDGVEEIGEGAFENLAFLSDVIFPEELKIIGDKAFSYTGLRRIDIPESVRKIGANAFSYCNSLSAVLFTEGLEEVGERAFVGCAIPSVVLPATVRTIGAEAFDCFGRYSNSTMQFEVSDRSPFFETDGVALYSKDATGKKLVGVYSYELRNYNAFEAGVSYNVKPDTNIIGESAFNNCFSLIRVTLPDTVRVIGDYAFSECSNLDMVNLPPYLQEIGEAAFKGTKLKIATIPAGVSEIGPAAFAAGSEWSSEAITPCNISVSEDNRFFGMRNNMLLRNLPDGSFAVIAESGRNEEIRIPDSVSHIASYAFFNSCAERIYIPGSVKNIDECAFRNCRSMKRLYVNLADETGSRTEVEIYFPEMIILQPTLFGQTAEYVDNSARNQYLDCIRTDERGQNFDFIKYDSLFESITGNKDKILIAVNRMKSRINLAPVFSDKYWNFLKDNAMETVETVLRFDDIEGINVLAELQILTGDNLQKALAIKRQMQG